MILSATILTFSCGSDGMGRRAFIFGSYPHAMRAGGTVADIHMILLCVLWFCYIIVIFNCFVLFVYFMCVLVVLSCNISIYVINMYIYIYIRHRASGTHGVWIGSGNKFRIKNFHQIPDGSREDWRSQSSLKGAQEIDFLENDTSPTRNCCFSRKVLKTQDRNDFRIQR